MWYDIFLTPFGRRELDDDDSSSNLSRFVTRKRGSDFDTREFSLMIEPEKRKKKYDFDSNDLQLPVLESPIAPPVQPTIQEPEQTVVKQESDEEAERSDKRNRKRVYKKRANPPDSPIDTEWTPTPKRKKIEPKRKPSRAKDPSSAKVVLFKLNDTHVEKRSSSLDPSISLEFDNRRSTAAQRDVSSDSDGSSAASLTGKNVPSRPRRQKAPTNLQEPSLRKKLRRN